MGASAIYTVNEDLAVTIPWDDTPPQKTEGTEVVTLLYAASTPEAKVRVRFSTFGYHKTGDAGLTAALFLDNELCARRTGFANPPGPAYATPLELVYDFVPGDTAAHQYRIRVGAASGVCRLNGTGSMRLFGGTAAATLTVDEV